MKDSVWLDSLDAIIDEVEQYRLDLVLHARSIILAATVDEDEQPNEEDDEPDLGDAFFSKPTSYLACTFTDCNKAHRVELSTTRHSFPRWSWKRDERSVGSFMEVLDHQHALHNFETSLSAKSTRKPGEPSFRLAQPLELSCAISAVIDIAEADPETVTVDDLDGLNDVGRWEWENSTLNKRFAWRRYGWLGVMRIIKQAVDKNNKSKPPRSLDVPCIAYHPVPSWQRQMDDLRALDTDEERDKPSSSDDSGEGGGTSAREKKKAALHLDSADEEESSDEDTPLKLKLRRKLVKGMKRRAVLSDSSDDEDDDGGLVVKQEAVSGEESE
ncbi:hypothetical protein JCM6882_003002 [Rhodosporidiobolus microsporus]